MTAWPDLLAETAAELLAELGEPVTLASNEVFLALFDPVGTPADPPWDETDLAVRISHQPNPSLLIASSDHSRVPVGTRLTVRGDDYSVTAPPLPDRSGLAFVELMPAPPLPVPAPDPDPE